MPPIYSGDVDVAPEHEDISALQSSQGAGMWASAVEGALASPIGAMMRTDQMSVASGQVPDLGGASAGLFPDLVSAITDQPKLSRADAQARVKAAGLEHQISVPDRPQINTAAVDLMIQHAREANARAATIADGPRGFVAGALDAGTSFLVGAADPLNVAASFVPVLGEARYAKLMASAGTSILGRAAVRAGIGAAQGAAFSAGFLPLDWAANTSDGRDFTLTQALGQVLSGAGQFGVLHVGGGLAADFWRALGPTRARKPLYPFAPGEPYEQRAVLESAAPHPSPLPTGEREQPELEQPEPAAAARAAAGAETAAAEKAAAPAAEAAPGVPPATSRPASADVARAQPAGAALDDVLSNPRIAERFQNLRIDSDHAVPFGAGADVDDPNLVHVDAHVPHADVINGVEYDPRVPVALHEIAEHDGMEHDGLPYGGAGGAHATRGLIAEKAWVDAHLGPGAWPIYQRRWDGWLAHIEHEQIENVPEGLYTKPYPEKERERIARVARYEQSRAGERKTIEREVSTAVARAGRPREEANAAGKLFAARYATRAARFGERAGSALDLFRAEHLGIRRGAPNLVYSGRAFEQGDRAAPPGPQRYAEIGGRRYVRRADGADALGEIPQDVAAAIGRESAPIRLTAEAEAHAEGRHGASVRQHGYADIADFVADVARNYSHIYEGSDGALFLVRPNGHAEIALVELHPARHAAEWSVRTAGVYRRDFFKNKKLLWSRPGPGGSLPGGSSPFNPGGQSSPNIGTREAGDEEKSFEQGEVPHWYYSAAGRAVEGAKQEKAAPEQWLGMLKNAAGVKAEELEWLGLPEWLKAHNGAVTRAELADYVRANQIEVREIEHGTARQRELDDALARAQADYFGPNPTEGAARRLDEANAAASHAEPKFDQYALPGGENYRELLLTLPREAHVPTFEEWYDRTHIKPFAETGYANDPPMMEVLRASYELDRNRLPPQNFYRSSHWDEPNVLAHVRFDDRVVDGRKTLHIAEIQSDWHQAGRKRGYRDASGQTEGWTAEPPRGGLWLVRDAQGNRVGAYPGADAREAIDAAAREKFVHGVPDAPFKTTWPELALKRMIRYAAENGYDRLTWDAGETNAERYDLSRSVNRIEVAPRTDARSGAQTRAVRIVLQGGRNIEVGVDPNGIVDNVGYGGGMNLRELEGKPLADLVGKEMADRIMASSRQTIEGEGLKVGGEGMRGFYDKILPAAANKLVKKFGAKVGEASLAVAEQSDLARLLRDHGYEPDEVDVQKILADHGGRKPAWLNDEEMEAIGRGEAADGFRGVRRAPVHAIDLTPQLREAALSQGFPLFQPGRTPEPIAARLSGDELGPAASFPELRDSAYRYYEDNFVKPGLKVHNESTGAEIGFNPVGLRKATRAGEDLLRLIPALPDLLRKARLIGSDTDIRGRENLKAVHTFAAAAEVGGKRMDVVLLVRETKDGQFHYSLHRDRDFAEPGAGRSSRPRGRALEQGQPTAMEGAPGELNITPLEQAGNGAGGPRGRITIASNRAIIDLFKSANASTFLHEAGHLWLEELMRDAAHDEAPQQVRDDLSTVLQWLGVDKPEGIAKEHHEKWARGFEQYLMEGRAPSKGLAAVFEKFREWLAAVYRSVSALNVPLTDEVRGVMDRMLASDPEIAQMQGALRRLPGNAKTDLARAAIGAMSDGKGVPAAEMIRAGAARDPSIAHAATSIPDVASEQGSVETRTPDDEAFRAIAERPAPENERPAVEAFRAAEALPEPPSPHEEPPRTSSLAAARAARQPAHGGDLDVDLKVNKPAARGPRARPEATWSLSEFLASRGGISPTERNIADLRALIGRSNKFIPGFGHLIRKGGMGLDRARGAAVEAGYLNDRGQTGRSAGVGETNVNDLLEALDDEMRGKRHYREGYGPPPAEADPAEIEAYHEQLAADRAKLEAALREVDIPPENADPELLARATEIMNREASPDPLDAYERAVMERTIDEAETGQHELGPATIPGWDELVDAGAAPHAGGGIAGAAGPEGAEGGGTPRATGAGAGAASAQSPVAGYALTKIAREALAADARSAANFAVEGAAIDAADRARVDEAVAAVDREAAITADIIQEAAAALGAGADARTAIEQTAQLLGDRAGRALIESEVQALDGAIKVFNQDGGGNGESAQRAADARLDKTAERAAIARRAAREHAVAVIREKRRLEVLQKQGVPVRDGLEAITGGVNTPFFRSRDSIDARWHTLHNKYVGDGGVDGALRREGLAKLAYSKTIDAEIEREAYELDLGDKGKPGVTRNPQALRIAQIFHAADKQAMDDHNLAGGWLRYLSGHTFKQQYNPAAIDAAAHGGNARPFSVDLRPSTRGQEADRLAFLKDALERFDLKRVFGRMPMQAIRDELYEMWVPLKNGDHFDYATPSEDPVYPNVAGKAAAHRAIFFKSAEDARWFRQKYGLYPSFIESKYRGWETLARQTALIGRLGPRPEEAIRAIRDQALKMTAATNERKAVEKFANGRGGGYDMSMLDKQMGLLTGKANKPLWQLSARIAAGWMVWERMSMLGRVLLTHIEGLPTKSSELRYWGASAAQRYGGFLSDMRRAAPESERGRLMQLIWAGHDADNAYRTARYDSADTAPGVISRLSDIYFRLTGVTHVLSNQRQGAQHVMARELGMERGKAFADIDPRVSRILSMYGLGEDEWNLLHGAEWTRGRTPEGDGPGGSSENAFLTPEDALALDDASVKAYLEKQHPYERPADAPIGVTAEQIARARNDLAWKLATMYEDRGSFAMFQGASVRTKARLYGNTTPGTIGGIALRLLWQFKQWPVEMIYRTWGRELYGGQQGLGRVASVVELAVAATVMGTLGEMVRDTLKGQNPLPAFEAHPVQYLMRGMMRSGVGSIAGDYLLGEFDRHFRTVLESVAGPTFGQINDLADLYYGGGAQTRHPWSQRAADLLQLVKTNGGPLVNFWATSWAFQYLVLFRLQEWMHPGYVERYQRKMEKEAGVSFIVSPRAAIGR